VLAWLSVWSEMQTCIWPSWCQCHSLSLASVKSRFVLPFWYRLTRVVPEKGPLNGCVCVTCACVDPNEVKKNQGIWLGLGIVETLYDAVVYVGSVADRVMSVDIACDSYCTSEWHCRTCCQSPRHSGCHCVCQSMTYSIIYFASAAVALDSSRVTASSSTSWSRFNPPSNFVNGHVSTIWFVVCHWPQSQGDWARPHLCKLADVMSDHTCSINLFPLNVTLIVLTEEGCVWGITNFNLWAIFSNFLGSLRPVFSTRKRKWWHCLVKWEEDNKTTTTV